MKMGRNVDWVFGKPIAIVWSLGAILGQRWMGLDEGQRWVLLATNRCLLGRRGRR